MSPALRWWHDLRFVVRFVQENRRRRRRERDVVDGTFTPAAVGRWQHEPGTTVSVVTCLRCRASVQAHRNSRCPRGDGWLTTRKP